MTHRVHSWRSQFMHRRCKSCAAGALCHPEQALRLERAQRILKNKKTGRPPIIVIRIGLVSNTHRKPNKERNEAKSNKAMNCFVLLRRKAV
ncbi:MAG: hypothetical protein IJW83_03120, partial [Clostridia bacterium]|nr:hypothetical protein [Clostridia bacterium]